MQKACISGKHRAAVLDTRSRTVEYADHRRTACNRHIVQTVDLFRGGGVKCALIPSAVLNKCECQLSRDRAVTADHALVASGIPGAFDVCTDFRKGAGIKQLRNSLIACRICSFHSDLRKMLFMCDYIWLVYIP